LSAAAIKQAFTEAAPYLREFQTALKCGRLVICAQCYAFTFADKPAELGECWRHAIESWPFIPFKCDDFVRRQKSA
jgi:hypothetical protein